MLCNKCGFICKGIETKCPYCGNNFEKELFLDKHFNLFGWTYITVKQLITILSINIAVIGLIVDLVSIKTQGINLHITPWLFLGIFLLEYVLCSFVFPTVNKNKLLFLRLLAIMIVFSIILMLSYMNTPLFEGYSNWVILLGYYYPLLILLLYVEAFIVFLINRKFNIFSTFFYMLFLDTIATVLFILSFIKPIGICDVHYAQLSVYVCFIVSMLITVNCVILSALKIRSRVEE